MESRSLDDIMSDRGDASSAEANRPEPISDAERAANPIGAAQRERDQQGRFAKPESREKPEADAPQRQGKPEGDKPDDQPQDPQRRPGTVPQQALEAERRKRQERDDELSQLRRQYADLERRIAMPQAQPIPSQPHAQPEAPPEFWTDPEKAVAYQARSLLSPVERQLQDQRVYYSRALAVQQHGQESVAQATQALQQHLQANPGAASQVEAQLSASMDPVGDMVRWHKQQTAMREIGDDPASYRARLEAEIRERVLAEMQGDQPQHDQQQRQQPAVQRPNLPTSFAGLPAGGPRGGAGYGGPRPLSEISLRG